jgi:hypothetical protein
VLYLSLLPTVKRVSGQDVTDNERCSYHAEHSDVPKLEYESVGKSAVQIVFQLAWQYITQTDVSVGGSVGFVSFINVYNWHFSPMA